MNTVEISIEGMSCGHCVKTVREALEGVEGARIVDVVIGRATIEVDEATFQPASAVKAIDDTGFVVRSVD